jgi:hypothetical protein
MVDLDKGCNCAGRTVCCKLVGIRELQTHVTSGAPSVSPRAD